MKKPDRLPLDQQPCTYTGLRYDPLYLTEGDIRLDDIAQSLALQCRYNGAINHHYSIAQHSVQLAHIVPYFLAQRGRFSQARFDEEYRDAAAVALMHDSSEAYLQDFISPIKARMSMGGVPIKEIEHQIEKVIFSKFGLDMELLKDVKEFDLRITINEKRALIPWHRRETEKYEAIEDLILTKWTPELAQQKFLQTAKMLRIDTHELAQ